MDDHVPDRLPHHPVHNRPNRRSARELFLPGRDPMGIFETAAVGIGGSLIAGLIALAIFHRRGGGGIILSIICAMGLVWLIRRSRERNASPKRNGFVGRR